MAEFRLKLVVAACKNRGIGIDGQLPWRLKKDMEFFKFITAHTEHNDKQNAVIMGRKTWDSIPSKFRPLKNRINIVLSNTMETAPEGAYLSKNMDEALKLTSEELKDKVESVFVIGGSSVYKEAMERPSSCRVYLTKVLAEFDCDVFLPELDETEFKKIEGVEHVPIGKFTEKDTDFVFEVYDKL